MDTSFWSCSVHTGIFVYLPLFFAMPILVPTAVREEVEREAQPATPRIRRDQQAFRLWLEDERIAVRDSQDSLNRFGGGEAACVALAQVQGCILLINESRAYKAARHKGILTVTVPEVVVRLVRRHHISLRTGLTVLDALADHTADAIIELARGSIEGTRPR